jgi:Ca2+ transporting ATPase
MENFDDFINQVLVVAAIVSIIIGLLQHGFPKGLTEGVSILFALVIIISVTSGNNYISEMRLSELLALSEEQEVAVYRNDKNTITIAGSDLVVGDLIKFEQGMRVPADCMMVEGQDCGCDEAELTGEPDEFEKKALNIDDNECKIDSSIMFGKTLIKVGTGKAIVLAVGENTASGSA